MNLVKKIASGIAVAAIVCVSQFGPVAAADSGVLVNTDVSVNKHYDPSHIGHSHQCNRCKKNYQQAGDFGQYSVGTNICPHCGYANPIPPSPYNPYTPPQPSPYYPPQPAPYNPYPPQPSPYTPPYNPGYTTVDDLLHAWDAASSYQVADSILVNGSARIFSLKGLFRLAAKVYYKESEAAIISNMERGGIIADITVDDACRCWDNISSYANADRILLISARYLRSTGDLTRLMRKAYYKSTEQAIANMISYAGGYNNNYNNYPNYPDYPQNHGHHYRSAGNNKVNKNLMAGKVKTAAVKNAASKKELEIIESAKSKLDFIKEISINLTDKDIKELDYPKISEFASNFKKGAYKKTEKLYVMKKELVNMLKPAAMQESQARELLEALK